MKCLERERLFNYAAGLLEARELAQVRNHVETCPHCREAVGEYKQLGALLDEWKTPELSSSFDAKVSLALAAQEKARSAHHSLSWFSAWWWAPATLALLVAVVTLVTFRSHRTPGTSEQIAHQTQRAAAQPPSANGSPASVNAPQVPFADSGEGAADAVPPGEEEVKLYKNLNVLEDYDMLANFEVLSELPQGDSKIGN
jgi:anti-sigma factor RsiW